MRKTAILILFFGLSVIHSGPALAYDTTLDVTVINNTAETGTHIPFTVTITENGVVKVTQNMPAGSINYWRFKQPAWFLKSKEYQYRVSLRLQGDTQDVGGASANLFNAFDLGPEILAFDVGGGCMSKRVSCGVQSHYSGSGASLDIDVQNLFPSR